MRVWGECGCNLRYEGVRCVVGLAVPSEYSLLLHLHHFGSQYQYYAICCSVRFDVPATDKL
eukprot:COSAG02_NODE_2893_length_7777_cov_9.936826_8_plen_61_part_00